jgi:hypothetical protein
MSIWDDIAKAFEDAANAVRDGVSEAFHFLAHGVQVVIETVESGITIATRATADFVEGVAFVVVREATNAAEALKQEAEKTWTVIRGIAEGKTPPPPLAMGARLRDPDGKVYLMIDGRLRHIPSRETYDRLFKQWGGFTGGARASAYPMGDPIDRGASLARDPATGKVYLVGDGMRRWIISPYVFDRYGFGWDHVADQESERLGAIPEGPPISGEYIPDGRRVVEPASGAVYLMIGGALRHIPNPATYNNLFRDWKGIGTLGNLAGQHKGPPLTDRAHLAKGTPDGRIFLIGDNQKRWIRSPAVMDRYQFNWGAVRTLPADLLAIVPDGEPIG